MADYFLQSGRVYDADGNIVNLVGLFGDGCVPIDDIVYDPEQYIPSNGKVLGEDGRAYALIDILRNVGGGWPGYGSKGQYVWIRYAAQKPASNADVKTEVDAWIGVYTGLRDMPPASFEDYSWYQIKGNAGKQGPPGDAGLSIAAATIQPDGHLLLTFTDATTMDCGLVVGNDGANGQDGQAGADGVNAYVWIRYADSFPSVNDDIREAPGPWMGVYSGQLDAAPTDYALYRWYHIEGAGGPQGDPGLAATIQLIETIMTDPGTNAAFVETEDSTPQARRYVAYIPKPEGFTILAVYPTLAALEAVHPTGNRGDLYVVGTPESNTLYAWDMDAGAWVDVGPIGAGGGGSSLPENAAAGQVLVYEKSGDDPGQWVPRTLDAADVGALALDGDASAVNVTFAEPEELEEPVSGWMLGRIIGAIKKWIKSLIPSMLDKCHPVGSIYMSATPDNPSVLFGGEWVRWGQGQVPVGVYEDDPDFDTPGKTGGEKSTTHGHNVAITKGGGGNTGGTALTLAQLPNATGNVGIHGSAAGSILSSATGVFSGSSALSGQYKTIATTNTGANSLKNIYFSLGGGSGKHEHAIEEHDHEGAVDDANISNMQPYITCYMWLRTA